MIKTDNIKIIDLGCIAYQTAYDLQKKSVQEVISGADEQLIICEHEPVLTLGRMTKRENILIDQDELNKKGIDLVDVDRGGDVTLHSPGQLIIYPILDLTKHTKDLHQYLYRLEQTIITFLSRYKITAERSTLNTGAWVNAKKIASIGIGVKKWISFHGIGINISTDLDLFRIIRPCRLDVNMTSLELEIGKSVDMDQAKLEYIQHFKQEFGYKGD